MVQRAFDEAKYWREINNGELTRSQDMRTGNEVENCWQKPRQNVIKCNVNGNWRNPTLHCGSSWIARDHTGSVLYHSREAFTCFRNRITAEFRVLIWVMQSLRDLHIKDLVIASDCQATNAALLKPLEWPRYRVFIECIHRLMAEFDSCSFQLEMTIANSIVRAIYTSVTRDGRFHSYIALGGPTWLHDLIAREAF